VAMFHVKHDTRGAPQVGSGRAGAAAARPLALACQTDDGVELSPVVRVASRAFRSGGGRAAVVAALVVVARLGVSVYGGWWIWCQPSGRLNPRHALGRVALPRYWLPSVPRLGPALRSCLARAEADARRVHRYFLVPLR
jgi:hypothetical protein